MNDPLSTDPTEQIASVGELGLLAHIREWLGPTAPVSPAGMGDDTAVLADGTGNLLTTDSLVFGRHFDAELDPALAGAKLLKRNLSDLAAMGGQPGVAVLAGFLPPQTSLLWLERFVRGLADCAAHWKVQIVGGDLTETDRFLGFNLTLTGSAQRPLLRGQAGTGDEIWVTGELGGSIAGHHARFTPRLPEGQWLAQEHSVRSVIDVTDGLAKDLPALLSAASAVALDLTALPMRATVAGLAKSSGRSPLAHVFTDGEDYELLFAAAPEWRSKGGPDRWATTFETRLTCLGRVVPRIESGAPLLDMATEQPIECGPGYAHFG